MSGNVDVDRMLQGITAKQFQEWELYSEIEPFNELREDWRIASILAMIANTNRGKNTPAYTIEQFVLPFGEEPKSKPKDEDIDLDTWLVMLANMHAGASDDEY